MKRLLLLNTIIFMILGIRAQQPASYHPFIEEGKVWRIGTYSIGSSAPKWEYDLSLCGDTLINNVAFKKMIRNDASGATYIGALYESNRQVFFCSNMSEDARLLYDFGVSEDDKVDVSVHGTAQRQTFNITHVIDVTVNNRTFHCIRFNEGEKDNGFTWNVWIQGIGSKCSPLINCEFAPGMSECLMECSVDGNVIYTYLDNPLDAVNQAITYRPLVEEGKVWAYENYLSIRPEKYNYYYWYYLQGDTVIGGKNCFKMYAENERNDGKTAHYIGALYEESKKVYMINPEGGQAYILYDFGCKEGDVITAGGETLKVVRIFTEQNEERNLRVYELLPTAYEEGYDLHVYWIEGVGCMMDFFGMIPFPGNYNSLVRCEVNSETLYQPVQPKYTEDGYHEMGIEGKTWNYIHHFVDEEGEHDESYSYVIKGDTVIQRRVHKKLYYQDKSGERYVCAILESGREVLKLNPGGRAYSSPYQFGRDDIGRVFDWNSRYGRGRVYWMLNTIDTIHVHGQDFRRLIFLQKTIQDGSPGQLSTIEDGEDVWHEIWIEGVGAQFYGIEDPISEAQPQDDYSYLVSCYENGECIFTAADFTTDIHNFPESPANGTASGSSFKVQGSELFDLSGRRLSTPPAKGLYIEDGRKRMVK